MRTIVNMRAACIALLLLLPPSRAAGQQATGPDPQQPATWRVWVSALSSAEKPEAVSVLITLSCQRHPRRAGVSVGYAESASPDQRKWDYVSHVTPAAAKPEAGSISLTLNPPAANKQICAAPSLVSKAANGKPLTVTITLPTGWAMAGVPALTGSVREWSASPSVVGRKVTLSLPEMVLPPTPKADQYGNTVDNVLAVSIGFLLTKTP
jgi:hypothetical protein